MEGLINPTLKNKDMKHTPGPWKVNKDYGLIYHEGRAICVFDGLKYSKPAWISDRETIEANAQLIARAPELLEENESLRKIQDQLLSKIRTLEDTVKYGYSEGTPLQHNKARIESLEAINKQLLEGLQHAVDLFKELHPPDGVHDCKFYESLIAKSKL